jgi:hypothetical protein
MSRSLKKNPVRSVTTTGAQAGCQKTWKKACNRRLRRSEEEIPSGNKYRQLSGDIWSSPSDGKIWLNPKDKKNYRK